MKTIAELAIECGVHRTTLNKAAERGEFPIRRSGTIILIDEESQEFKTWLQSRERTNPMIKLIERQYYYEYPSSYPSRLRAAKAAQKLEQKLSIFTDTLEKRDEDSGELYFVVITKNDVPH